MCLDFDRLKNIFKEMPSCFYVGYSVSSDGKEVKDGMYVVIRLKKNTPLKKAFKFFRNKLKRIGVNLDESCKDYTRLRFFSHDSSAFFNPTAKPFNLPAKVVKKAYSGPGNATQSDTDKVLAIIKIIEDNSIDITSSYEDWYKIAGALFAAFGDAGRDYFHRVSRFHKEYKQKAADRKFDNCMNMKNVSLSSFFHVATSHGIRY